jgi:aldose 1-epimerase
MTGAADNIGPGAGSAAPTVPPGWEAIADAQMLHRIEAPGGRGVAWVCPEIGGNTVAYAVDVGGEWVQVLAVAPPDVLREFPSRYGFPILFPFPGGMRNGRYQWAGQEHVVPPTYPGSDVVIHGFAHVRPWRMVRESERRVVCELRTPDDLDAAQAASYPFEVRVLLAVSIDDDGLSVHLAAYNEGDVPAPLAMGLHPYIGEGVLGPDRSVVRVELPGRSERGRFTQPGGGLTGERRPAPTEPVAIVPLGQTMLASRTDLPTGRTGTTARVLGLPSIGGREGWTVDLWMDEGFREILMFAPEPQPSLSIEPQTHMPGAASQPEGDPDGLVGLEPGQSLQATATLRLVPPAQPA